MNGPRFQEPQQYTFQLDGGYDLVTAHHMKKPGSLIAGSNVEMVSGRQGYSRPGGFERCVTDDLPSTVLLKFIKMKSVTGGSIVKNDMFTGGTDVIFRALIDIPDPDEGDVLVATTHSEGITTDLVCYGPSAGFTVDSVLIDLSNYSKQEIQEYQRLAIEQVRDLISSVPGAGSISGGFRLRGKNYAIREGILYRGDDAGPRSEVAITATSFTSVYTGIGAKTFTTQTDLGFVVGRTVSIRLASDPPEAWFEGNITSYDSETGELVMLATSSSAGSFAYDDWNITSTYLTADPGVGSWTTIEMPQVMYFDEGVYEFEVGDFVTDGTATATITSITEQGGVWNYSSTAADQANGYLTLGDVSGTFTEDATLLVGETVPNITNGEFSADTNWTKGDGWTIDAGVASSDGSQTVESDLSQAFVLATGRSVTLTYALTLSAGDIRPFLGDTVGTAETTAGAKTVTLERTTGDDIIGFRASSDFVGTIDDVVRVVSIDTVPAVVNGTFTADSDWTKGTGWTIGAGVATCSGAQTAVSELSQAYDVDDGISVIMTFTITRTGGTLTPFLGASNGEEIDTAGTYAITITRTTGGTTDDKIGFRADADFAGPVDNVTFTVGRRAKVKSVNVDYVLPTGGDYKTRIYNFSDVADADSAFGVTGVGEGFEFDGTTYVPIFFPDFPTTFPFLIDIHQERLHIGFPGGQWVLSVSGRPRVYNALLGSTTYSTGSELVGSRKIHGNALAIFCEKAIWLLLGTGVLDEDTQIRDWQFLEHDSSLGAVTGSVAEKGPPMFVSGTEYRVVYPTDDSAGYKSNPILNQIQPLLENNVVNIVCSLWCRKKSQHRLFLSTGGAIYATFESGKPKGGTPLSFPIPVSKVWSAIEDSVEKIFFLSTTGYLYRMDSGNTFDDDYIKGSFRIPFFHYGNSRRLKSFPQMEIEFSSPVLLTGDTEITYTVNHAYGESGYPRPATETIENTAIDSAGGFYGANAGFGFFVWGGPVVSRILGYLDGYGPNMSILVVYKTRYDAPFTFLAATVDYIQLGLVGQET